MKQVGKIVAVGLLSLGLLLTSTPQAAAQAVTALPKLDLARYMGVWYEVAHYPDKSQKHCTSDAVVLYALGDKSGQFQVITSCRYTQEDTEARNANGKTIGKNGDGRLKVTYLWPFSHNQWVLAAGPSYEWALVGSPNHKLLRVLSRTSAIEPELLVQIKEKAAAEGFDPARLVMIPQTMDSDPAKIRVRPAIERTSP